MNKTVNQQKKVKYLIRLDRACVPQLSEFCTRNNLPIMWSSASQLSDSDTILYETIMSPEDITAIKLSIPILIMETTW